MSGKATGWVLRNGPENKGQRAVLHAIADEADIYGENARIDWPTLMERSSRSRSSVAENIRALIAGGWVEVVDADGPGRGRVTVYRLPGAAAALGKGPEPGETATLKGPGSEAKRSRNQTVKGPENEQSAEVVPLFPKTVKPNGKEESPLSDDVAFLCEILADRVATQQDDRRPAITPRWHTDMRLLLERGPLGQAQPEQVSRGKIHATIDFVFDEMAEPEGNSNFCWADQVRSPGALRRHWHKMAKAAKNKLQARRSPTARILDRLSPGAGSGPLPVHLLHPERKALPS